MFGIGGIGMQELIVILVIVLLVFGAGKLPEIGSALGKSIKNFKQSLRNTENKDDNTHLDYKNQPEKNNIDTNNKI